MKHEHRNVLQIADNAHHRNMCTAVKQRLQRCTVLTLHIIAQAVGPFAASIASGAAVVAAADATSLG